MKKEKCIKCSFQLEEGDKFCSSCGREKLEWWKEMDIEDFLEKILGKGAIVDAYWNDDYVGFTTKDGDSLHCGYEDNYKLAINSKEIIGISTTLKYYYQLAPKEAVDYHLASFSFYKKIFAGLAVLIQLKNVKK